MEGTSSYQFYQELPPSYRRATRSLTSAVCRVEFELRMCSLDSIGRESWAEPFTISLRSGLAWEDFQNTLESLFRQRSYIKNKSFAWRTSLYFANGSFRKIDSRNWEEVLEQIMSLDSLAPGSKDWPMRLVARSNMMTSSRYEELMDTCERNAAGWDVNTWKDHMLCGGWCLVPYEREPAPSGLIGGHQSPQRSPSHFRGRSPERTSTSYPFTSYRPARGRSTTVNIAEQTRRNSEIDPEARGRRGTRGGMRRRPGELEKWDERGYMPFF